VLIDQSGFSFGQWSVARILWSRTVIENGRVPTCCCGEKIRHALFPKLTQVSLDNHIQIAEQNWVPDVGRNANIFACFVYGNLDGIGDRMRDTFCALYAGVGKFAGVQCIPVVARYMRDYAVNVHGRVRHSDEKGNGSQIRVAPLPAPAVQARRMRIFVRMRVVVHEAAVAKEIGAGHASVLHVC